MHTVFLSACLVTVCQVHTTDQRDDLTAAMQERVQYWLNEFDGLKVDADVAEAIARERMCQIAALTKIVADDEPADLGEMSRKEAAIRLLGRLAAVQACDLLIGEIEFKCSMHYGPGLSDYPAAQALCAIGGPARRHLLHRLRSPTSPQQRELIGRILECIDASADVVRYRLELELRNHLLQQSGWSPGLPIPTQMPSVPSDDYTINLRNILQRYAERPKFGEKPAHGDTGDRSSDSSGAECQSQPPSSPPTANR